MSWENKLLWASTLCFQYHCLLEPRKFSNQFFIQIYISIVYFCNAFAAPLSWKAWWKIRLQLECSTQILNTIICIVYRTKTLFGLCILGNNSCSFDQWLFIIKSYHSVDVAAEQCYQSHTKRLKVKSKWKINCSSMIFAHDKEVK